MGSARQWWPDDTQLSQVETQHDTTYLPALKQQQSSECCCFRVAWVVGFVVEAVASTGDTRIIYN